MDGYTLLGLKLAMGIIELVLQINIMGKGNLAPTSAMDQVQNYVLGGIIGGVIYSDSIGVFQFSLVLVLWTLLVFTLGQYIYQKYVCPGFYVTADQCKGRSV